MNIEALRKEYKRGELKDDQVDPDPLIQFRIWFEQALHAEIDEVNAMALATSTPDGKPSVRMVLLKVFNDKGFTFFSNYDSRKGEELKANSRAALLIYWKELERQVRLEGKVEYTSGRESDTYFDSRNLESRISAAISPQSKEVPSRRYLEEIWVQQLRENEKSPVKRPANWGGYRLIPDIMEFWQGRPNRLHDRIVYRKMDSGWKIVRLAP